ncbi:MAG: molecular chaperone DnaJ [Vigna little leaf phytoplasma]|nr:molecular chaperone DnaJ [Vigna little leaf phytoplasma]
MKQKKDYYAILGLSKDANENEIKSAYRKLAKKYHPDVSKEPDATAKFKEVQEAYEVLNDPKKKAHYDRFGHNENINNDFSSGFQGFESAEFDFGDIFENFFGGRNRTKQKSNVGEDKNINITLDFIEAVLGVEREISYEIEKDCIYCHGTGAKNPQDIIICNYCRGTGYVTMMQKTFLGNITSQQVCSRCQGKGKIIINKCSFCKGNQRIRSTKKTKFKIPAGVDNGTTLEVPQQGNEGHLGSPNGNLYINIQVQPHNFFKRIKQDITSTIFITIYQAVLGAVINISTIDGKIDLKIPEGIQNDTKLRLKNKGVPYLNSSYRRGDHYVIVKIKIPTALTKEQKDLFRQLEQLEEMKNNTKKRSGFWNF